MLESITPMCKLVKHEEASKLFEIPMFYTEEDMTYHTEFNGSWVRVFVPRGFLTDGASVPKIFQKVLPVWDTYYQAAVFHDYLCEYLTVFDNQTPIKITRTEADTMFLEIMEFIGVSKMKRKVVYAGVSVYDNLKSIIYPSANVTKRQIEDKIRKDLLMRDKAIEDQKKK